MTSIAQQIPIAAPAAEVTPAVRPAERSSRIDVVDGARGAAIILVMLLHFSMYGHGLKPSGLFIDRLFYRLTEASGVGVDLFLVVSGFLITGILYDTKQTKGYFRNFYARRVLRIFPLYYFALLLFLVVLPWLRPDHSGLQTLTRDGPWYWTYLINVKIARDGWPAFGVLGHFWSLALQEQFYLVWPIFVLAFNRRQLQIACIAAMAGAFAFRVLLALKGNTTAAFVLAPARVDAMALGAFIALTARGPLGLQPLLRLAKVAVPISSIALLIIFIVRKGFTEYDPVALTAGHSFVAIYFGAVLVLALAQTQRTMMVRLLESRILRFFGKYSYGMYVFHHPILFFKQGILPLTIIPTIYGSQLPRQLAYTLAGTAVSLALGMASWHLLEKQFLQLKNLFPYFRPRLGGESRTLARGQVLVPASGIEPVAGD